MQFHIFRFAGQAEKSLLRRVTGFGRISEENRRRGDDDPNVGKIQHSARRGR